MYGTLLDAAGAVTDGSGASAYFFGWMGCAVALIFTNFGAAYGTAKSGVGLMSMGVMSPGDVMKNTIPIVMAGILGIYGLIVSIILASKIQVITKSLKDKDITNAMNVGYKVFAAGLCCGLSGLASGFSIGIAGDAGVRAVGQQGRVFVGLILIMIFSEAIGLYGFIVALVLGASG